MTRIAITSEAELADVIRGRDAPLEIIGAGTKRDYGKPLENLDVLDVSALSGILSYEPEELVITARAATPVAEIEAAIAEKNQRLGFDPADWGPLFGAPASKATIAGALSADTSGSARVRFGGARDHLLGYRAVNGLGEAYKAGGRVVKNVTGFDLPKLICGAMGTLGVLTEVTLRLVPRAHASATLVVKDIQPGEGLALLRRVWSSPLEATGLAYVHEWAAAYIRLEGGPTPLKDKIASLRTLLHGMEVLKVADGEATFRKIGSGAVFIDQSLDIWRICVPPSEAAKTAEAIASPRWLADWAGGLLWVGMNETADLHDIAKRAGGHATLMRASVETRSRIPVFPPEEEIRAALTRSVKAAFDPKDLFNPGRMG
ncbi:MAG TPA: FAD-binding protein [Rhizomicrobium sp.]|nr:FAD-binding protein [Rhizomicrobium sp.]